MLSRVFIVLSFSSSAFSSASFPARLLRPRFAPGAQLRRCRKASRNDAAFLKTEIVAPARSRRADDDVVDQLELKDSAGFVNSPGEAHIGFGRGGVARYAACGITGLCRIQFYA